MDKLVIQGGCRLKGEVRVSGIEERLAADPRRRPAVRGKTTLRDVPDLADVRAMIDLLGQLGATVTRDEQRAVHVEVADESHSHAEYDRVRKMRASICVLGPLLAKRGYARVAMPGGCAIGPRPVDLHLRGLRALGANIELDGGDIVATAGRLKGTSLFLGGPFGSTVLARPT